MRFRPPEEDKDTAADFWIALEKQSVISNITIQQAVAQYLLTLSLLCDDSEIAEAVYSSTFGALEWKSPTLVIRHKVPAHLIGKVG